MSKNILTDEYLLWADVFISNALATPEMLVLLAEYAVTEEKLKFAEGLRKQVVNSLSHHSIQSADNTESTKELKELFNEAYNTYIKFVKISRMVFTKNDSVLEKLQLNGERKKTYTGFSIEGEIYYTTSLSSDEIISALSSSYNITKEKLEKGLEQLNKFKAFYIKNFSNKTDSKELTKEKDEKIDEFIVYMQNLKTIAKIALDGRHELLEKLGL